MGGPHERQPELTAGSDRASILDVTRPPDHAAQHTTGPFGGRWCPYCGADLSSVPERQDQDDALFAVAGRRLKVALAVGFVLVWLAASMYDFLSEPGAIVLPGWYSALGGVMLFYLLGFNPLGMLRRKG